MGKKPAGAGFLHEKADADCVKFCLNQFSSSGYSQSALATCSNIEGIPRCIELCLRNACTLHRNVQQNMIQLKTIRPHYSRRMFPACLILTNASLKCKKFQNISLFIFRQQKSLSYRFFTASINLFPYFSYLCLPTPVTFSISSSFPGFRMHIWIRVLSEKTI